MADITNILLATASQTSAAERQAAEATLDEWKLKNYPALAHGLATEIATEGKPVVVRQMASIYLKNSLHAQSAVPQKESHDRWKSVDAAARASIKETLLAAFRSAEPRVPHFAAVAAAEIAAVELPYQEWPQFVPAMMDFLQNAGSTEAAQQASLECLGFTAERIVVLEDMFPDDVPELPPNVVDKMLTAIVDGVQPTRPDVLRLAALTALHNSLTFVRKNMEVPTERDFIINHAICAAATSHDAAVRHMAFACMEQVAEFYYDKLQDYMTTIFQLTVSAIQKDSDESVRMAAIEFWSTVSILEQSLLDEEVVIRMKNGTLDRPPCKKYVETAMPQLVPLLLETLPAQDDDPEDGEEWNVRRSGAVALELISQTVEGLIVPVVMPFVQLHIGSDDWRKRDAAIVAFASILEGPSTSDIGEYVTQSIPVLLGTLKDSSPLVRDTATHCIANICRLHMSAPSSDQVHAMLQGLMDKLKEPPATASHAAQAIFNIAEHVHETAADAETNILSVAVYPLIDALFRASDREDAVEGNLRVGAMSAASELVSAAAHDVQPILRDLLPATLLRMEKAIKMEVLSKEDAGEKEQLLGLLCGMLLVLFQKLPKPAVMPHADHVMTLLLQVLQVHNATCHEDVFLAMGQVAVCLEDDFSKYLDAIKPFWINGLRSFQIKTLCQVSVGMVVDICGAVGGRIQPLCDDIMGALMDCLKDAHVHREVKPVVISCFGDIAMAICGAYEPYLQVSTMLLMQAAQQQAPPENEELVEFINSLRVSILEAYSGILMGLADGKTLHLFAPNVQNIMQFLQFLAQPNSNKDDGVLQKAVALIGDMAMQLGSTVASGMVQQPFVMALLQEAATYGPESDMGAAAHWASQHLQQVEQTGGSAGAVMA